jgi:hypothetical protein
VQAHRVAGRPERELAGLDELGVGARDPLLQLVVPVHLQGAVRDAQRSGRLAHLDRWMQHLRAVLRPGALDGRPAPHRIWFRPHRHVSFGELAGIHGHRSSVNSGSDHPVDAPGRRDAPQFPAGNGGGPDG